MAVDSDTSFPANTEIPEPPSGGGGTPGGSNAQVQFNDSGSFGGDAGFTYIKGTDKARLTGGLELLDANAGVYPFGSGVLLVQGLTSVNLLGALVNVYNADATIPIAQFVPVASGVNYLVCTAGATGSPYLITVGGDAGASLKLFGGGTTGLVEIIRPLIAAADWANANHDHSSAARGGQIAISAGISGLAAGIATFLGTPSSANLLAAMTTKTGTGLLVFDTSPTLVTPALGTPSSGVLSNCTGSSLTAKGVVELATTAEINTGTDTTRAMPVDQFVASNRNVRYFLIRCVEATTDVAIANIVGGDVEAPFAGTITEVGAYVDTAGTTGVSTVDINKNGTTILSTKITIDSAEKSSRTAATPAVISVTSLAAGDLFTIDVDGVSTTKPKGLTVRIGVRMS